MNSRFSGGSRGLERLRPQPADRPTRRSEPAGKQLRAPQRKNDHQQAWSLSPPGPAVPGGTDDGGQEPGIPRVAPVLHDAPGQSAEKETVDDRALHQAHSRLV